MNLIKLASILWRLFERRRVAVTACLLLMASFFDDSHAQFAFPYGFDESAFGNNKSLTKITDLVQKSDGTIWALTDGGEIRKIDGANVKVFAYIPNESNSTKSGIASTIYRDNKDDIWVAYKWGDYISKISHKSENFVHFKYTNISNKILAFSENENDEMLILNSKAILGIKEDSLFELIYEPEHEIIDGINIGQGKFVYFSDGAFHTWNRKNGSKRIVVEPSNKIEGVAKIVYLNSSTILFQTKSKKIKILDLEGDRSISDLDHGKFPNIEMNDAKMLNDSIGMIATSTEGLLIFNLSKRSVFDYIHFFERRTQKFELAIECLFIDQMNVVWITKESGIAHLNLTDRIFENYTIDKTKKQSLENYMTDIISLNAEEVLIANRSGQIQKLDKDLEPISEPLQVSRKGGVIFKMHALNDTCIFISADGELYTYNPSSLVKENLRLIYSFKSIYSKIKVIEKWGQDTLLLTLGVESALYSLKTGEISKIKLLGDLENSPSFRYVSAYTDKENLIWLNTSLGTYLLDNQRRLHKVLFCNEIGALKDEIIPDFLHVDSIIYLATMHAGVWKAKRHIDFSNDTIILPFVQIDDKDGLNSKSVFSLAYIDSNLWMGTNLGISMQLGSSNSIYNYDRTNGLTSNDFSNQAVLYIPNNKKLVFAGNEGLDIINTTEIKPFIDRIIPKIHKIEKSSDGEQSGIFETFDTPEQTNKLWVLPYRNNYLNIHLSSNSYFRAQSNKYRFKLVGRDKSWNYLSSHPQITLVNLNPGDYSLEVSVQGHNTPWSEAYTLLRIQVPKPFWQELWFTLIAGIALFLSILFIFQLREQRNIALQKRLEKIVEERTEALNENTKVVEKQNEELKLSKDKLNKINTKNQEIISILSHDFRGPLATLKGFLMLLSSPQMQFSKHQIDEITLKIGASLGTSLALLDNLLYWSRDETGLIQLNFENLHISEKILSAVDFFKLSAEQKNIEFILNVPQNVMIEADANMIDICIRNLLSNALKFTPKDGKIEISLEDHTDRVSLIIKDSGVGLTPGEIETLLGDEVYKSELGTDLEKGTGLGFQLVKRFIKSHIGKIKIQSNKGIGSQFEIVLPKFVDDKI